MLDINSRYAFNPYVSFDQYHTYDNKKFYNTISCEDYLIYQLQVISKKVIAQIKKIKANIEMYGNYINEIKTLTDFGKFQFSTKTLNLEKLIKIEKQILRKNLLSKPIQQFGITVTLSCSTLNGRIYEKKHAVFSEKEIIEKIKKLNNKNGDFYNDRSIWDAISKVERGKVSNRMRFAIYERDGYRCRKCGASERSTDLEIDHIIPIAKGGKSTFANLQTLCHKCNVEKGDRIDRTN